MKDKHAIARLDQAENDDDPAIKAGAEKVSRLLKEMQSRQRATRWGRMSDAEKLAEVAKRRTAIDDAVNTKARTKRELHNKLENAIRSVCVLDNDQAQLQVQTLVDTLTEITLSKPLVGDPTPFRDAGVSATKAELKSLADTSAKMVAALRGLHQPAILALADAGFLDRIGLLRTMQAVAKSARAAKRLVDEAVKRGSSVPPRRGRTPDPVPSVIARLVARHFRAMVGAEPNADGRGSRFATMLEAVFEAAEIEGNARHYAAQAINGRDMP